MVNLKKNLYQLIVFVLFFIFINNTVHANNIKNSAVIFMYHKFDMPKYPTTNITIEADAGIKTDKPIFDMYSITKHKYSFFSSMS